MKHHTNVRAERPVREAIAFLVYDLILIVLAYVSTNLWMTLLCAFLAALVTVRVLRLFEEARWSRDQLIEEEFGLRIGGPRK